MSRADDLKALALYKGLMEEAKARIDAINMLAANPARMPPAFVREYCFLHIRMLCEIISIACLVAHGDMRVTRGAGMRKAWHPDEILQKLGALHPRFFPVPVIPKKTPTGWHLEEYVGAPYLSKEALRSLHGRCGGVLHHRSLKKMSATSVNAELHDVFDAGRQIVQLLNNHRIQCIDDHKQLVTFLADRTGAVAVAYAEAPREDSL